MESVLYFIVPCYNDADTLTVTAPLFRNKVQTLISNGKISKDSRVLFIDDCSTDSTKSVIKEICESEELLCGIALKSNCGEQNALIAGMTYCVDRADCVITIDSDLQDDINAADEMLNEFENGADMVLGVRSSRDDDPLLERITSGGFYALMKLFKTGLVNNHSNYRLMSRNAVKKLLTHTDEKFFLPALVCNLGIKYSVIYYKRTPRAAGKSSYNIISKSKLALTAVAYHTPIIKKKFIRNTNYPLFEIAQEF